MPVRDANLLGLLAPPARADGGTVGDHSLMFFPIVREKLVENGELLVRAALHA